VNVKVLYRIFTDGVIERGDSIKETDPVDPRARSKFIKDVLAQTGGNALLPCQFNSPGIFPKISLVGRAREQRAKINFTPGMGKWGKWIDKGVSPTNSALDNCMPPSKVEVTGRTPSASFGIFRCPGSPPISVPTD
ncbi:hypothetical protein G5I_02767, partial [Acromyrmex echinatior]